MAAIIRYRSPRWVPIAALLFLFSLNGFSRTWKDASGNFEVDAEFVKVEGGTVYLKLTKDGKVIGVALELLSAEDRAHVESAQSPPAATMPGPVPGNPAAAADRPQSGATPGAIPNEDTKDSSLLNLGPIGVRVRTERDSQGQGVGSSGEVAYLFANSPAAAQLLIGDRITGVNGKAFRNDLGERLGAAIDLAEGSGGQIALEILRDGEARTVLFDTPMIGSYSKTFPYDCDKSKRVLAAACDWLADRQKPNGRWENEGDGTASITAFAGLALLSTGDPKYEPQLRATADFFVDMPLVQVDRLTGWKFVHASIFLAEYYLQTGEPKVKEKLVDLYEELRSQQLSQTAYPYWFSHGRFDKEEPGEGDGYVYLGVQVANCLTAWSLMRMCGVDVEVENFANTWEAVKESGPTGEMPYAPVRRQRGGDGDAWGRTGMLAMACYLSGDEARHARAVVGALSRQWETIYFNSHGSSAMGKTWGTLGTAVMDPKLFRQLMDRYKASFDLMRLSDGRFVAQPAGTHPQDFTGGYLYGCSWTTAINALIFSPAHGRLRIAGGGLVIRGVDRTSLRGPLEAAFAQIEAGRHADAVKVLTDWSASQAPDAPGQEDAAAMRTYLGKLASSK